MGLQFLFMDDNAPCHRTVAAEQLLESRRLAARTLPPVTIRQLRLALLFHITRSKYNGTNKEQETDNARQPAGYIFSAKSRKRVSDLSRAWLFIFSGASRDLGGGWM
ncbi:hypothetical protein TNCV_2995701 [Trichonephila clavipes]|nr:hypothetical protein TNCV_2995701 [Trichonephila clavipes]